MHSWDGICCKTSIYFYCCWYHNAKHPDKRPFISAEMHNIPNPKLYPFYKWRLCGLLDVLCSESSFKLMGLQHLKDQNEKQILCWPILDKIAGGRSLARFFLHPITGQKSFDRAMTWESFLLLTVLFGHMSSVRPGRIKVQAVELEKTGTVPKLPILQWVVLGVKFSKDLCKRCALQIKWESPHQRTNNYFINIKYYNIYYTVAMYSKIPRCYSVFKFTIVIHIVYYMHAL